MGYDTKHTIVVRRGIVEKHSVFILAETVMTMEPVRQWRFYPVRLDERTLAAHGIKSGEACEPDGRSSGLYRLLEHRSMSGEYLTVALVDGGETKAVHYEEARIEPPKVRRGVELRWNMGRWEKLLKKGWVAA